MTFFAAKADLSTAGGHFGLAHEAEDIRAVVVPFQRALDLVDSGEITSGPTALALLCLHRHKERLLKKWA